MSVTPCTTGYARLSPSCARAVLAGIVAVAGLMAATSLSPLAEGNADKLARASDLALYRAVVQRVHAGEPYHQALQAELIERGYPTQSLFNWRPPLPLWLVGQLPDPGQGKLLLGCLAAALLVAALAAAGTEAEGGTRFALLAALLLTGTAIPCFLGELFYFHELWSGVLIALSLAAYGLRRSGLAVLLGLAALACRELALPYCVLMAAIAWRQGRRGELVAWIAGLAGWLAMMAWHSHAVSPLIPQEAIAHRHGWLRYGGMPFVIAVAQMNAYLVLLPQWVTALYLAAALVGLAGWNSPLGQRVGLAVCGYLAAFAAVGQEFNQYWGWMIAPALCLGAARFPFALRDLLCAAAILPRPLPQAGPIAPGPRG